MRTILLALVLLTLTTPALATDGVLEINQTCAVETGCFAGDTAGYPVTITEPGTSYVLTSRLIVPDENTDGIVISTSDVGIDLNNFAIIRSGCEGVTTDCTPTSGSGSGVERTSPSNRGLSVKNGSITGMGLYGVLLSAQAEVTNLRVRWNRLDGILTGLGSTISGNTAYQNGSSGITGGSGSTISGNTAYQNAFDGINASNGSIISGNTAFQNGNDGIDCNSGCTVIGNTAYDNGDAISPAFDDGIECGSGCIVRGNSVRFNSGYGLRLDFDSAYSENVVTINTTGTVTGSGSANIRGGNYCAGAGTGSAFCP